MYITISQFENLICEELENIILEKNDSYGVVAPPGVEEYQQLPEPEQNKLAVKFRAFLDSGRSRLSDVEKSAIDLMYPSKTIGESDEWPDFIGAMADDVGKRTGAAFYSKIVDTFDKWLKDEKVFNIGIWQGIQGPVMSKEELFGQVLKIRSGQENLEMLSTTIIPKLEKIVKHEDSKAFSSLVHLRKLVDITRNLTNELINDYVILHRATNTPFEGESGRDFSKYVKSRKKQIEAIGNNIARIGVDISKNFANIEQTLVKFKKELPEYIKDADIPQDELEESYLDLLPFIGSARGALKGDITSGAWLAAEIGLLAVTLITLPVATLSAAAIATIKFILGDLALIAILAKFDDAIDVYFPEQKRVGKLGITSDLTPDWIQSVKQALGFK